LEREKAGCICFCVTIAIVLGLVSPFCQALVTSNSHAQSEGRTTSGIGPLSSPNGGQVCLQAAPSPRKDKISITVDFPAPEITEVGGYHRVTMSGLESIGDPGEPLLPSRGVRVLIPYGSEVKGVRVFHGREVILHGSYYVEPGQMPVPLGSENRGEPTPPDERIYNSHFPFPAMANSDFLTQSKRGYRILILNLYPVSYVPAEGRLSYFENMTVEVEIGRATTTGGELPLKYSAEDRKEIASIVDNPETIDTYPQQSSEPLLGESLQNPPSSYQYVIITNEALKNSSVTDNWGALMAYKNSRGITTNIVTTEWIYANYSGVDNPEKIRNFIKDAYTNWGTEYVLLGGYSGIIPPRMFYVDGTNMPADMYYSCLDGTFNYDNDSYWGEPNDGPGGGEVDLYAEVYVGRAPVANEQEMSNFVKKTLAYEDFTPADKYSAYMVGEHLGFGGPQSTRRLRWRR